MTRPLKPHWIASLAIAGVGLMGFVGALAVLLPRGYEADRTNGVSYTTPLEGLLLVGGFLLIVAGAVYLLVTLFRWSVR